MSKIFEALHGAQARGEVSELLPALVESGSISGLPQTPREDFSAPAGRSVPKPAAEAEAASDEGIRKVRLAIPASLPVLPFEDPGEQAAEQYRIARTKIVHHSRKPRLITVTSPGTGDGKTVTAINLAGALSLKASGKVLLVDADFRRSAVHALLGLAKSPGLAEVIAGVCAFEDAVVETVEYPHLHVLTSGESEINPSELLETPRWHDFCDMARGRYEYAILDAPPIGAVADGDLIQLAADGVVMVLRPDYTRRGNCLKAFESIPKDKLLGVLMNGTKAWPFGSGYGYGYGYGGYQAVSAEAARKTRKARP